MADSVCGWYPSTRIRSPRTRHVVRATPTNPASLRPIVPTVPANTSRRPTLMQGRSSRGANAPHHPSPGGPFTVHTVRRSLSLAALTACTLLASACGSTSTSGPAPTTPKTTAVTTTPAPTTATAPTPTAVTSAPQPIQPLVPAPPPATPPTTAAAAAPPPPPQAPTPEPTTNPTPSVYYKSCADAKRAGAAPLHRGDPGYRPELDRDGDGIACEK